MRTPVKASAALLLAMALALAIVSPAQANRQLLTKEAVKATATPDKQIEGACGVAVSAAGQIFVSDYYHRAVDVFSGSGGYQSQTLTGTSPEGPCGLAIAFGGALYANYYHQGVVRLEPSFAIFDEGNDTGVAVDAAGNVYANHRTYVSVYQPSGEALLSEGQPLKIGLGSLEDAYGLAVSTFAATLGNVYVADASDDTVKVYEPSDLLNPSKVITGPPGGFSSLTDAALAIDPTNGHLLIADNLQPGFEHPEAAILEFDAEGRFLSQLPRKVIDAEPPGLAFDLAGSLYATSGNSEEAQVFQFGPYTLSGPEQTAAPPAEEGTAPAPQQAVAAAVEGAPTPATQSASPAKKQKPHKHKHHHRTKPKTKRAK